MSSVKNCLSMIIGCSNIVLGSKVAPYNYISKEPADTSMPPILPPGKGDCELACARTFCWWRLGCRCLHLSKKKTHWWAWVLLYLSSRALQGQGSWNKPQWAQHCSHQLWWFTCLLTQWCSVHPSPACAGDALGASRLLCAAGTHGAAGTHAAAALLGAVSKAQTALLVTQLISLTEVVFLCHLASSRHGSALLCPKENIAISQGWVMTLLKNWMEKNLFCWNIIIFFSYYSKCNFLFHLWFVHAFQNCVEVSEGFYREMFHFEVSQKRFENFRKF